jgi:hypothetical protein
MFCPLCQAEYRDGVTQCSDCAVALVESRDVAQSSSAQLWDGDRQHLLDKILAALDAHGIPSHYKEIVNMGPQVQILGISLTPRKSTFEYQVWVFRSDLEKARAAIADID